MVTKRQRIYQSAHDNIEYNNTKGENSFHLLKSNYSSNIGELQEPLLSDKAAFADTTGGYDSDNESENVNSLISKQDGNITGTLAKGNGNGTKFCEIHSFTPRKGTNTMLEGVNDDILLRTNDV